MPCLASGAGVFDLPVAFVFAEREVPDTRLDLRIAIADLRHVPRRAAARDVGERAADLDVALVELQRLRLQAVERAREGGRIDRRINGLRRPRVETVVGAAVPRPRFLDQGALVDDTR